jgi:riboflavin synthase
MFTGLIESVGAVSEAVSSASGTRLRIATTLAAELGAGDSLAVNGVCLTIASRTDALVEFDIGPETTRVTTLALLRPGNVVNLERAMRADSRFGGHLVQGHVDGTGTMKAVRDDAGSRWLTVTFDGTLAPYMIAKGSVAVDGVSLTIAALRDGEFDVMVIPFTWQHTNLHARAAGDRVNLECDMVGKYVARAAETYVAAGLSRFDRK